MQMILSTGKYWGENEVDVIVKLIKRQGLNQNKICCCENRDYS